MYSGHHALRNRYGTTLERRVTSRLVADLSAVDGIARALAGLCVLLGLVSCDGWWDGSGTTHLEWTEDVVLASGERLTIAREQDIFFQKSLADGVGTDRGRRSVVRPSFPDGPFPE